MKEINHEYYVSLEVAKRLKEAGFDWECEKSYACSIKNPSPIPIITLDGEIEPLITYYFSAPTLDVAQRWLREVKNTDIFALRDNRDSLYYNLGECDKFPLITSDEYFDTYEQALEAGIQKALEMILEKGE